MNWSSDDLTATLEALRARRGDTTSVEVPTKRGLIQGADRVVLLADHTKFPGQGSIRVCDFGAVAVLVTTALADPETLAVARAHGTEVLIA